MKNKMGVLTLTGVLALTAAFSMTAFAEEISKLQPENSGSSIVQGDLATADIVENTSTQKMPAYVTTSGTIESVTEKDGSYSITVANNEGGIVFHVQGDAFVISRKDNSRLQLADLKQGMEITGIVKGNSPQTLSLPPQTPGAIGFVVNDAEGSISVGDFDKDLINMGDSLQLNISNDTVIVDQKGTKKIFTADDVKNQNCLVLYTITTRSIPAQTSPSLVMILDAVEQAQASSEGVAPQTEAQVEDVAAEPVAVEAIEATQTASATAIKTEAEPFVSRDMVSLRSAAEACGYTIEWTGNDQPVVLERGGIQVSVTVGQPTYQKNGITLPANEVTTIKDSQIYIAADVADALK